MRGPHPLAFTGYWLYRTQLKLICCGIEIYVELIKTSANFWWISVLLLFGHSCIDVDPPPAHIHACMSSFIHQTEHITRFCQILCHALDTQSCKPRSNYNTIPSWRSIYTTAEKCKSLKEGSLSLCSREHSVIAFPMNVGKFLKRDFSAVLMLCIPSREWSSSKGPRGNKACHKTLKRICP